VEVCLSLIMLGLSLLAAASCGHMLRAGGGAGPAAAAIVRLSGARLLPLLTLVALPLFVVGMFVGLSGVAVLAAGVVAVPALRQSGFDDATMAAIIAVMATAGMIAPPMNVPAMLIADGVNMPWTNTSRALLALALPLAAAALVWFTVWQGPTKPRSAPAQSSVAACLRGFAPLLLIVMIWIAVRLFPTVLIDPASPLILVIGGLAALPM